MSMIMGNHLPVRIIFMVCDITDMREILMVIHLCTCISVGIIAGLTTSLVLNVLIIVAIILLLLIFFKSVINRNSSQAPNQAFYSEGNNYYNSMHFISYQ